MLLDRIYPSRMLGIFLLTISACMHPFIGAAHSSAMDVGLLKLASITTESLGAAIQEAHMDITRLAFAFRRDGYRHCVWWTENEQERFIHIQCAYTKQYSNSVLRIFMTMDARYKDILQSWAIYGNRQLKECEPATREDIITGHGIFELCTLREIQHEGHFMLRIIAQITALPEEGWDIFGTIIIEERESLT
eukprot:m.184492 g.184492  ORF g.184492 m.184492 type:complete len:192 (-) comp16669_c5_seq2:54-629(-)